LLGERLCAYCEAYTQSLQHYIMARGNQRDLSREKNLKKQAAKGDQASHVAPKAGGVNTDAIKLAEKLAKKAAAKAAGEGQEAAPKDRVG
jgi:hypothetical protein